MTTPRMVPSPTEESDTTPEATVETSTRVVVTSQATTSFDEALERTVKWYQANEPWWRAIKERSAEYKAYYEKQYAARLAAGS